MAGENGATHQKGRRGEDQNGIGAALRGAAGRCGRRGGVSRDLSAVGAHSRTLRVARGRWHRASRHDLLCCANLSILRERGDAYALLTPFAPRAAP